MILRAIVEAGNRLFTFDELKRAYHKTADSSVPLNSAAERAAYCMLLAARRMGVLDRIRRRFIDSKALIAQDAPGSRVYDEHFLNLKLNRIYDLPEVEIDNTRQPTINVLVPAFEFKSISAGFFGVFQVARFMRQTGYKVRLVLFDNFYFSENEFRRKFQDYPGMENLLDEVEVEYIGERKAPLYVNKKDFAFATVWYSAFFAEKISKKIGRSFFFYLIQDYEANFYPGGSLFSLADQSYEMNYHALFSTKSLQDYFVENDVGGFRSRNMKGVYFENACSSNLPEKKEFVARFKRKNKKSLVFYSRPVVDRNMFELTALALSSAYKQGVFDPAEWECIGMGLGEGVVELLPGLNSTSLPRMTLREYSERVSDFDVCLTLMASPHPSLIPMDLAGSGALVVTNTFRTKTKDFLNGISANIIPARPNLPDLVDALREAVARCEDLEARYENARKMNYPRDWEQSLTELHLGFLRERISEED